MRSPWKASVSAAIVLLAASLAQATDSKEIHQTIPLDRMGVLITDCRADPGIVAAIREAGVDVRIASGPSPGTGG